MSGLTSNAGYITGINEVEFMSTLKRSMKPGSTVYNVGANVGYLALYLANHLSNRCQIIAFEPDPFTFQLLQENVLLNNFNIRAEQMAVGDHDGTAAFVSFGAGDGRSHVAEAPEAGEAVIVPSTRIDSYNRFSPDWIIMDVEGYGAKVAAGASATIRGRRCMVAAEIHSDDELDGIEACLLPAGYKRVEETRGRGGHHIIWAPA